MLVQVETDKLVPTGAERDGDGGVKATVVTLLATIDRATVTDSPQRPHPTSA